MKVSGRRRAGPRGPQGPARGDRGGRDRGPVGFMRSPSEAGAWRQLAGVEGQWRRARERRAAAASSEAPAAEA